MLSSVGLEVMNSTNPELSWKSAKGRRSKKSIARNLNSSIKAVHSISPKRVGDFSGSDFEKFGEYIPGQEISGKSENVPLKKRRHLLESPLRHPSASSLRCQNYAPSRTHSSSPLLEDHIQLQYSSCPSGDFSGIELLAAAASMDDGDKKDILPEYSSIPNNCDPSSSATLSEQYLKNNQLVNSSSNIYVPGDNVGSQENNSATASQSLSANPDDGIGPKVDRKHWDLNTLLDAWGEPYDDSIAGDISKDVNGGRHMEDMKNYFGDHVPSHQTATADEKPSLKVEQDKSTSLADDGMHSELSHLKENIPDDVYQHFGRDTSNQACEKDPIDKSLIKASTYDADLERLDQVTNLDTTVGISPLSKLCCSPGMLKSEGKNNSITGTDAIQGGDCSSSMSECERIATLDRSHTHNDEVNAFDVAASETVIDVKPEDIEVPPKTSSLGAFTLDTKPVTNTDSNKQTDEAFLSNSTVTDCKQYLQPAELGTKLDVDTLLPNGDSVRTMLDTCKNYSAGAQFDEPTTVGGIGLTLDGRCNPVATLDNHADLVNGDDLTGFQEGYDSPYEDGELRGSFLCSGEENEMENECVDYESDGRNGNGSDTAEYLGSEIVEDGSEGSNGSRRSLSLKAEGKSKSGAVEHGLKEHAINAESGNNEIAGKVSNTGSGSTVEQCMEMPMKENDDMEKLELLDQNNAVNVGATHIDEYESKAVKGKLQSRIEGRSSADATEGKDAFFIHQSRSSRFAGSYPRPERDISPDKYLGRYRSAAPGERDGVHQWTSWGSRRRYTTNYQSGEGHNTTRPRSKTGESSNKIDVVDFHEPRQASYLSKGLHRPLMRRSPVERDDYFGVGRIPLTRGVGDYRSRGNYLQRPGRDFVENFEPLPDDAGASVRIPHYISRREQSFSPGSGRQTHRTLPRRRSRSRSRTRSPPRAWQNSHRERMLGARRLSRSPDFRSGARMERMRMPFTKPSFASDYGEDYISPSRGRFSPQQNCRWVEDRNFTDNHMRRRRSPVRVFRRTQRFDGVGSSGRLKPDEYFRLAIRPGRFSYIGNGGRECKLESNYDDRRRDDGDEISHGGNIRRFRQNTGGGGEDFETKNMNYVDDGIGVAEEREDKKAF